MPRIPSSDSRRRPKTAEELAIEAALGEQRQREEYLQDNREARQNDLLAAYFWADQRKRLWATRGYAAEAERQAIEREADAFEAKLLNGARSLTARALTEKSLVSRRAGEVPIYDRHVAAELERGDDDLLVQLLKLDIRDYCRTPGKRAVQHLRTGNARIVDHARLRGWNEERREAEGKAFTAAAIGRRIEQEIDNDDPAAAGTLLDWGADVLEPQTAQAFRGIIDSRLARKQARSDAGDIAAEIVGQSIPAGADLNLELGRALIENKNWTSERKEAAASALEVEALRRTAARLRKEEEAGRTLGALLDERTQAGAPVMHLKQLPISLRFALPAGVVHELQAGIDARHSVLAGSRPQPDSPLLTELAGLAATEPERFRRRLVHPDLIRGRLTDAEAKALWQMRQAIDEGVDDGAQPHDILRAIRFQAGKAATPDEQAREGHLLVRIHQRIRREFTDKPPTLDQLRTLAASEIDFAQRREDIVVQAKRSKDRSPAEWEAEEQAYEQRLQAEEAESSGGPRQWDGTYDGLRFRDDPDLQRSAFLLGAYDNPVGFDVRLGVTEKQLGHLPPGHPNSLAAQLVAENPTDSRRLIFLAVQLRAGAQTFPQFAPFLMPQISAIEAEIAKRRPAIEAADAVAGRAQLDVVKAGLAPLDTLTAGYRLGVNREVNAENIITLGTAGLPVVGKGAGKTAGKVADVIAKADRQAKLPRIRLPASIMKALGAAPKGKRYPHRHHVLPLNGQPGAERELVREGQDILRAYGIDPIYGIDNLTWASNRGHKIQETRKIVSALRKAAKKASGKDDILAVLEKYRQLAAER